MPNPYNVGNWVKRPHFYGRAALATELLRDDRPCSYLVGMRRIGKTSLLRYIEEQRGSATGLFLNLQRCARGDQGKLDSPSVAQLIKHELGRKARSRPELAPLQRRIERASTLCDTVQELAWAAEDNGTPIMLLWDEAEKLCDLERAELEPLRSIMQDSGALRTVVAATKGLSELNERGRNWGTSPFLYGFVSRPIASLDDQEAAALILQLDNPDGPVKADSALVAQIAKLCGNHPFLIQRLCEQLYQSDHSLRSPTEADVVVDEQLADIFRIDFEQLCDGEQHIMRILSKRSPQSEAQLQRATKIGRETLRLFLHGMEQLAYIRYANGGYEPGNAFLARWLKILPPETMTSYISDRATLDVIDSDRQHLQNLRVIAKRRLHILEVRAAKTGADVEPAVMLEIEDLRAQIRDYNDQLGLPQ